MSKEIKELFLEDFVGFHKLSGVDFETVNDKHDMSALVVKFRSNNKVYLASEDACDGYRSCMKEIIQVDESVKNIFPAVKVLGFYKSKGDDLIEFRDVFTNKIVLVIGTYDTEDYYPSFVGRFTPENISVKGRKIK